MVAVVQYDTLDRLPPVLSLLLTLKRLGEDVVFIGLESQAGRAFLEENAIPFAFVPFSFEHQRRISRLPLRLQYLFRAPSFMARRKWLRMTLRKLRAEHADLVVWFQQVHAAALLGNAYRDCSRRVLTLFEMQDRHGENWFGFDFNQFIQTTNIAVCEYNRAFLVQSFYDLKDLPLVITNKPVMHPRECHQPLPECAKGVFEQIGERPLFLYQGYWDDERREAGVILETIAKHRPEYCVLSLPASDAVRDRFSHYPNAFTLPFIPAPGHLAITSRTTVGVAAYSACRNRSAIAQLNSLYCAPNKIYEYAGYGIPTLCNDIPGLRYSIGLSRAGLCCDCTTQSILAAADEIVANLDEYKRGATQFFDAINVESEVLEILKRVRQ